MKSTTTVLLLAALLLLQTGCAKPSPAENGAGSFAMGAETQDRKETANNRQLTDSAIAQEEPQAAQEPTGVGQAGASAASTERQADSEPEEPPAPPVTNKTEATGKNKPAEELSESRVAPEKPLNGSVEVASGKSSKDTIQQPAKKSPDGTAKETENKTADKSRKTTGNEAGKPAQQPVKAAANPNPPTKKPAVGAAAKAEQAASPAAGSKTKPNGVSTLGWSGFFDNEDQTTPSDQFWDLSGSQVEINGYMGEVLSFDKNWFLLIPEPGAECPFDNGDETYWNKIMIVFVPADTKLRHHKGPLKITGRLDVGIKIDESGYKTMFRLYDASFEEIVE